MRATRQCHQQNHRRGLLAAGARVSRQCREENRGASCCPLGPACRWGHRVVASFEAKARASRQCHQQNHGRGLLSAGAASLRSQNALWCQSQRSCGRRGSVTNKTMGAVCSPQGAVYKKILLLPPNVNDIGQGRGVFPRVATLLGQNTVLPRSFPLTRDTCRPTLSGMAGSSGGLLSGCLFTRMRHGPNRLSAHGRSSLLLPANGYFSRFGAFICWLYQGRLRRKRRESAALFHAAGIDNISPV